MRRTPLISGLILLFLLGTLCRADSVLYTARVVLPEAEVRSGPGGDPKLYATNKLPRDATVEVVKELPDGWLAIKPPPLSFSWINSRFLKQLNATTWMVMADPEAPVPVRYGSALVKEPPTVESVRIARGTQVVGVDDLFTADDGKWLPIEPPPGELRYIRAQAVQKVGGIPATASAAAAVPSVPVTQSPPPSGPDPRWAQAQQAELAGDMTQARRLYQEMSAVRSDPNLAAQAAQRLDYLNRINPAPPQPAWQAARVSEAPSTRAPIIPIPSNPSGQTVAYTVPQPRQVQYPVPAPVQGQPVSYGQAAPPIPAPQPAAPAAAPAWVGHLRLAGRGVDYRRTYVLESSDGRLMSYVTGQQGIDLEPYVNRNVQLYGSVVYRGDLRANYMMATQVSPLP